MRCLVTGAGGFIGGYLVKQLLDEGHEVTAVDIKAIHEWWQVWPDAHARACCDLRSQCNCEHACEGIHEVYQLAADMGGIGFIETHKTACMRSVLINTHMVWAAVNHNVQRYFYTSSACVYRADLQDSPDARALREEDAYPALAEAGYGWEKLFSEQMCQHAKEEYGLECRVVRLHNVYGPHGSWNDGREKAPAAICRKVAEAVLSKNRVINIWGDGTKTRSFMWIGDCIEGIHKTMDSDIRVPINLGSTEQVSINQLVDVVENIAGVKLNREYDPSKPQGVAGRNSDNAKILSLLGWEPTAPLKHGLERTYAWIKEQVQQC